MFETVNSSISHLLYSFSTILLFPVLLAIVAVGCTVLLWLGGFLREALERNRVRDGLKSTLKAIRQEPRDRNAIWRALQSIPCGLPFELVQRHESPPVDLHDAELALNELESSIADRLARCHFITRMGPMLGLLGTLIPFGPALLGLSAGDVQELSVNLVTAFATTVVGLFCGCLTFGMGQARNSWYSRDFNDLEVIMRNLVKENDNALSEPA